MIIGQIFFIILLLLSAAYIIWMRNLIADRIILVIFIVTGILFVIFPEFTTKIANLLGIGRGADLILYLFILLSIFMFIYVLSEINKVIIKITKLVRLYTINNAKDLTNSQFIIDDQESNHVKT